MNALTRRDVLELAVASVASGVGCAHEAPVYRTRTERSDVDGFTHIGNATHLLVMDGVHVLTDPWLRDPADTITQHRVPPAPLPVNVDVVLITHEHEDHFDPAALALLNKRAVAVVPVWLEARTKAVGFTDVRAVKPGDALEVSGMRVDVVRGKHEVDEVVYRIEKGGRAVLWAGDSLVTPEIEAVEPVDLAILPADAGTLMGTRWVMNADEAVKLGAQLGQHAILTHHEYELTSPVWSLIASVSRVDPARLPAWFRVPNPGELLAFPWMRAP